MSGVRPENPHVQVVPLFLVFVVCVCVCVCVYVCARARTPSCVSLFATLMDYSPPGSTVHGVSQARILR